MTIMQMKAKYKKITPHLRNEIVKQIPFFEFNFKGFLYFFFFFKPITPKMYFALFLQSIQDLQNTVKEGIQVLRSLLVEIRQNSEAEKDAINQLYDSMQQRITEKKKELLEEVKRSVLATLYYSAIEILTKACCVRSLIFVQRSNIKK